MYAVIKAGGKQQRVKPGDVIEVELMRGAQGEEITFAPLLVVDDDGKPHVGKELGRAVVKARLVGEEKGEKVRVFKYRPKSGYARRQGHRQMYTLVEILDVGLGRRAPAKSAGKSQVPEKSEDPEPHPAATAEEPAKPEPQRADTAEKAQKTQKTRRRKPAGKAAQASDSAE